MNIGTLRKILVTLGQILCHAVRNKYLENNPVREAERPKPQALFQEEEPVGYGSILITGFLEQVEEGLTLLLLEGLSFPLFLTLIKAIS